MFLDLIKRRNHKLITASQKLHQKGLVPANSYIIDLDIVEQNAKIFKNTAEFSVLWVNPSNLSTDGVFIVLNAVTASDLV